MIVVREFLFFKEIKTVVISTEQIFLDLWTSYSCYENVFIRLQILSQIFCSEKCSFQKNKHQTNITSLPYFFLLAVYLFLFLLVQRICLPKNLHRICILVKRNTNVLLFNLENAKKENQTIVYTKMPKKKLYDFLYFNWLVFFGKRSQRVERWNQSVFIFFSYSKKSYRWCLSSDDRKKCNTMSDEKACIHIVQILTQILKFDARDSQIGKTKLKKQKHKSKYNNVQWKGKLF